MGAGRSGSTVLGVVLGNCRGVFFAGELEAWLRRSGVPNFADEPERARFWEAVREQAAGHEALFGERALQRLEHSRSLLRLPRRRSDRELRRRYRDAMRDLYETIAELIDDQYIVDTSHYPLRARELRKLQSIDVHLVYLARDPQGVVASFARQDVMQSPKRLLPTNLYLFATHLLSTIVFLSHPRERRVFVRHEDFIRDPAGVAYEILRLVGATPSRPDLDRVQTGTPFQGNRLISSKEIKLETNAAPKRQSRSWLTAALQLPWALVLPRLTPRARSGKSVGRHADR